MENLNNLSPLFKQIETKVLENRQKYDDAEKLIKDFRRIFDQDSSHMNQAIFNDAPTDEIYHATLNTVATLIEILLRSKK